MIKYQNGKGRSMLCLFLYASDKALPGLLCSLQEQKSYRFLQKGSLPQAVMQLPDERLGKQEWWHLTLSLLFLFIFPNNVLA